LGSFERRPQGSDRGVHGGSGQPRDTATVLRQDALSRAEGETDQNAGKKNNREGHWYVVKMNVAERKATVRVGTGADGGWGG